MAFNNVSAILGIGSPLSSAKLLLLAAWSSRPPLRPLCMGLLQPFVHDGEVKLEYRCYDDKVKTSVRVSDLQSDLLNTLELCAGDTYHLDPAFQPDLVVDGGGNIGLFTLRAGAAAHAIGGRSSGTRFVICEPVPRNLEQIRKHLAANGLEAEVMEGCLGGSNRTIPFYVRDAIDSSFDPTKPFFDVIEMPVYTLRDAIGDSDARRILIKLDIEGMEIETLRSFLPGEERAIYLVGELHEVAVNKPLLEAIFNENGWAFEYLSNADDHANFRACSPAARPLLSPEVLRTVPAPAAQ